MARSKGVEAATRDLAASLFEFLVNARGFDGPELLPHGVAYHRAGTHVVVAGQDGREPEVTTMLEVAAPDGGKWRARLGSVYVGAGLGPAQDVPESAPTRRLVLPRLERQAHALQRLLAVLEDQSLRDLVKRRHGT